MFSVTALGTRPVSGPLIDGLDRKKLLLSMICALSVTAFGYAFLTTIPMIIVFRLLHGVSLGCIAALAMAMAANALPEDKIAYGMGVFGMSGILAMAFGPGIGLYLAETFSYSVAFSTSGVLLLGAAVVAGRMRIEPDPNRKVVFAAKNIIAGECIMPAFFLLLVSMVRATVNIYIVIYITQYRMIEGIAIYYFINAAALLVFQPLMGKITDRFGVHISLGTAGVFFIVALLILAYCTTTWQLWLLAMFVAIGFGTGNTQLQALSMRMASPGRRGVASTTSYIGMDLGDLIGPVIAGFIIAAWSYQTVFLLSIIPIIVCAVSMAVWLRRHKDLMAPKRPAD